MNKDNDKVKKYLKLKAFSSEWGLSDNAIRSTSENRPALMKFFASKIDEIITGGKQLLKTTKKSK